MLKNYAIPSTQFKNLYIKDIGEETAFSANYPPKQRPSFIIHFVLDGEGIYTSSNSSVQTKNKISKGQAFVIYKNDVIFYHSNPNAPLHYWWISFDGEECEQLIEYIGFSHEYPVLRFNNVQEIIEAFSHCFKTQLSKDKYSLFISFFSLIQTLQKNTIPLIKNALSNHVNPSLILAEKYIHSHINENLSIDDIAQAVHLTRSHFSRLFKGHFGVTPHEYVTKLRLRNAEVLLTNSEYSISQIANSLNFPDIYSFSKLFKKHYRRSPSEYRQLAEKTYHHT